MGFEIVTDSAANLTDELIDKFQINIISLSFLVGDKEYRSYTKGQQTNIKQFYDMMRNGENIRTSHINMEDCQTMFKSILDQGKDVIYIGLSSALSGTYNTSAMVSKELQELYPDRKIYAIDGLSASLGQGMLVYYAAKLKSEGKSIDEVYNWLNENILHLCHWFTVDDLFFLKRGGRISAKTALVGTIIGIKPVMHMDNEGKLVPVGKVRGRRQSLEALVKKMEETCINPQEQTIFISHGDCIEDAHYVENLVKQRLNVKDVIINYVDPVIGAHSGPGTVALFFLGTER